MMDMFNGQGSNPDMQKMLLAQALMGGGTGGGAPQSFAGGLAQGMNPMMKMMMMQHMMGQQPNQQPITESATMQQPATTPFMLGGSPQP